MKILIFIFFIMSFPAHSEIILELSGKKLPVFNMPILKDNENFFLIEKDPINKINYVAHNSCSTFKIIALTENREIFFNEKDIRNLIETAHDYADIFCPDADKVSLVAATGISLEEEELLFKTSIVRQEKWQESLEFRKNHALERKLAREEALKTELKNLSGTTKFAYLLGVKELDSLPSTALDACLDGRPKDINALLLVDSLNDGYSTSSYPIAAAVYGLPEKVGYFLVKGVLTAEEGQNRLLSSRIEVKSFWECRKKGCSEFYDIDTLIEAIDR